MNPRNETFGQTIGNSGSRLTRRGLAGLAIVFMLTLVVAGPWITYKPQPFTGEGSPLRQYTYMLVFGLVVYAIQLRDYPRRALAIPLYVTLALAYCWITILWSDAAGVALRRLILTSIIVWTIFAAVQQVGFDETLRRMRKVMLYVLIINFAVSILIPRIGVHGMDGYGSTELIGDWRGILVQKNFAGAFCAATVMVYVFCNQRMRPLLRWGVILGALIFLLKTNSKTSLALLAFSIVCAYSFTHYHPRFRILVLPLTLLMGGMVAVLAASNWDFLMTPFRSEDALTGRVQIWPVLITYWREHPWLGAGYGSFWNIGANSPLFRYVGATNWVGELGNGHNGYLDLLVTIGLPGLIITVLAVFVWPMIKLVSQVDINGERRGFLLGMLLFCTFHNFTESSLFERDTIVNVFLMFTLALLHVAGNDQPLRRGYTLKQPQWRHRALPERAVES